MRAVPKQNSYPILLQDSPRLTVLRRLPSVQTIGKRVGPSAPRSRCAINAEIKYRPYILLGVAIMDRGESGFAPGVPRFASPFFGCRMAAIDVRLREANWRARVHENFVSFAKLFGFALSAIGVILVLLDVTKIVLLWRFLLHFEHRFAQIVNVLYSFLPLLFGLSFFYSLVETTRSVLQVVAFSAGVVLVSTLLFPSDTCFAKNIGQAAQLGRLQQGGLWKELLPDAGRDLVVSEAANRLVRILGAFSLTQQLHPLGIQDVSMVPADYLLTIQYCLVTHAALSLLFLALLLLSTRIFFQMLQIL
ncbi:hypothetical protein QR680_005660 [Steinernema hermaphroditum]|uniref:Uncharacterized protein n=1 Tax=Steinernema hermaphroditum TaxID=289476 RepID=A0AA39LVU5_9BILA|nr:hypothetical protein QR680_005660 [Steinernema hermaphroditum]